jgi:hypothetical protein
MELYELNNIRKNEISVTALIYTIEDYLYSKALKVNGVGKAYAALYKNTIAHKLIDVDARERAFDKLVSAFSLNINNRYGAMGDLINHHLNDLLIDNNHLRHYIADAKYFDTNNLQDDAFSKLFAMYVNGLKAMPKTKLTNVTKYFAINGNTLTVLDMNLIIKDYDHKIAKLEKAIENAKDEDEIISLTSKKDAIEIEKNNVKKVMKYIKDRVISYQIEEKLLKYTSDEKLSKEEKTEIYDHILDLCFDNYSEYLEMKHRVKHMYDQLDNLAGSNSPSKIALIRFKESTLSKMIKAFDDLDQYLEWKKLQLSSNFEFEDASRTLVIHEVKDMDKVISLVQELIGRGVITSEKMIKDSIENGTPLMRNLNPGFKEFAQDALAAKGVKEFKKKKPKKQ